MLTEESILFSHAWWVQILNGHQGLRTDKYLFWILLNFCIIMSSFSLAFSACYQQYNIFKDSKAGKILEYNTTNSNLRMITHYLHYWMVSFSKSSCYAALEKFKLLLSFHILQKENETNYNHKIRSPFMFIKQKIQFCLLRGQFKT